VQFYAKEMLFEQPFYETTKKYTEIYVLTPKPSNIKKNYNII